jgi:hypothetical protein
LFLSFNNKNQVPIISKFIHGVFCQGQVPEDHQVLHQHEQNFKDLPRFNSNFFFLKCSSQEVEVGGVWSKANSGKSYPIPASKTSWQWWRVPVIPATQEADVGALQPKPAQEKVQDLFEKETKGQRTWGMA